MGVKYFLAPLVRLIAQAQIGQKRRAALFGIRPGVARKSG
jgi:hypothetical protein